MPTKYSLEISSYRITQLASGGKYLIAAFCTPKAITPAAIPAQEKAGILNEKIDPSPKPYNDNYFVWHSCYILMSNSDTSMHTYMHTYT